MRRRRRRPAGRLGREITRNLLGAFCKTTGFRVGRSRIRREALSAASSCRPLPLVLLLLLLLAHLFLLLSFIAILQDPRERDLRGRFTRAVISLSLSFSIFLETRVGSWGFLPFSSSSPARILSLFIFSKKLHRFLRLSPLPSS